MILRPLAQFVTAIALGALGILLSLESAEVVSGRWRRDLASYVADAASPTWDLWISALLGFGLAILGVMTVAAQLAPRRKGLNRMYEVYNGNDGSTQIRGRAAINAACHELSSIEGVLDVSARVKQKRMQIEIQLDDQANLGEVEDEARSRLDHGFWIDLGLADFTLDLLITYHPNPPRVR